MAKVAFLPTEVSEEEAMDMASQLLRSLSEAHALEVISLWIREAMFPSARAEDVIGVADRIEG